MRSFLAFGVLIGALALVGCGESAEEEAEKQVCSARDDIHTQVQKLQSMTLLSATADSIEESLDSIRDDLGEMKDAAPDLAEERKKQVEAANSEFESQFESIAEDLGGGGLSLGKAKARLDEAGRELATSYDEILAKIDCE